MGTDVAGVSLKNVRRSSLVFQWVDNIRDEVPVSLVQPIKVRRKDDSAPTKRSSVLEAGDSCTV